MPVGIQGIEAAYYGEAAELESQADGYREAKVSVARGEAARFEAVLVEYQRAPEVTRQRLYLEAMEEVLPKVQKLVIEPGTATLLPYLPGAMKAGAPARDGNRGGGCCSCC